jgi:hypothetical protein
MTVASGFPNFVILGSTGYFSSFTPKGQDSCTATNFCASAALPAGYVLRPDIVPGVPLINPHWNDNPFASNFTPYVNPAAFAVPGSIGNPRLGNAPRTLSGARTPREFIFDVRVKKGCHPQYPQPPTKRAIGNLRPRSFRKCDFASSSQNAPRYRGPNSALCVIVGFAALRRHLSARMDNSRR